MLNCVSGSDDGGTGQSKPSQWSVLTGLGPGSGKYCIVRSMHALSGRVWSSLVARLAQLLEVQVRSTYCTVQPRSGWSVDGLGWARLARRLPAACLRKAVGGSGSSNWWVFSVGGLAGVVERPACACTTVWGMDVPRPLDQLQCSSIEVWHRLGQFHKTRFTSTPAP